MQYRKDFIKSDGRRLLKGGPRDQQLRAKVNQETGLVDSLMDQVIELKTQIQKLEVGGTNRIAASNLFTAEQVDEEIRRAVSQAMAEATISLKKTGADPDTTLLVKKYKQQILDLQKNNDDFARLHKAITNENKELKEKLNKLEIEISDASELKKQIAVLEQSLVGKDELIDMLKSRPAIINGEIVNVTDPDRPQMEQKFIDPLEKDAGDGMKSNITARELTRDVDEPDHIDQVSKLKSLLGNKLPKRI
jgi:hypothetical protein